MPSTVLIFLKVTTTVKYAEVKKTALEYTGNTKLLQGEGKDQRKQADRYRPRQSKAQKQGSRLEGKQRNELGWGVRETKRAETNALHKYLVPIVAQGQHIPAERSLQLGLLEEIVLHYLREQDHESDRTPKPGPRPPSPTDFELNAGIMNPKVHFCCSKDSMSGCTGLETETDERSD